MDAKEFFSLVVVENYKEAIADPANLRKLWNAAVSMNTVAEYLALHRAGYPTLERWEVDEKAKAVRSQYPNLKAIKSYADRLKHVRKHEAQQVTASSTSISPQDPTSFVELKDLVERTLTCPDPFSGGGLSRYHALSSEPQRDSRMRRRDLIKLIGGVRRHGRFPRLRNSGRQKFIASSGHLPKRNLTHSWTGTFSFMHLGLS
jgi:hypothetical protein